MSIEIKEIPLSDYTKLYMESGLSPGFIQEMAKVVVAIKSAGYVPYDQLYGCLIHGNIQYITRLGGAREIVKNMDANDIELFLKYYKKHK